jgi:hypothetical protein
MNSWTAVGCIFAGFGILFLTIGLFVGTGIGYPLFMVTFLPFGIISVFMFIIGCIGLHTGQTPKTVPESPIVYEQQSSSTSSPLEINQLNPPPPREALCPSCGKDIIFIQQYQRWYCPNEKKYI